jgi:hypothetical protein
LKPLATTQSARALPWRAFPRCLFATLIGLWPFLQAAQLSAAPAERSTNDFVFIDNGQIRLGVKKSSGAGIAYLALSATGENLINHWDRGRLVQQSYYGAKDGSMWDKTPWRWNPVQGGGWRHEPARVLKLEAERHSLYARTIAKHWATGLDLPEVIFEEWIALTGHIAHVRFRMTYAGTNAHPEIHHELPAVFVEPHFETLLVYEGKRPWSGESVSRSKPGWPNESRKFSEHWAAFVNASDFGMGVFVPVADSLTCYRFGDGKREHGSCSYFAPLKRFAITPGMRFDYDVWLTIGTAGEIRERFQAIASGRGKS